RNRSDRVPLAARFRAYQTSMTLNRRPVPGDAKHSLLVDWDFSRLAAPGPQYVWRATRASRPHLARLHVSRQPSLLLPTPHQMLTPKSFVVSASKTLFVTSECIGIKVVPQEFGFISGKWDIFCLHLIAVAAHVSS